MAGNYKFLLTLTTDSGPARYGIFDTWIDAAAYAQDCMKAGILLTWQNVRRGVMQATLSGEYTWVVQEIAYKPEAEKVI